MPLSEFLPVLFQALDKEGVRFCVLRNYDGFPDSNVGHDIDFLINPSELPLVLRTLQSIQNIRIVGYSRRHYVANIFVEGVSQAKGIRALELDFDLSLTWKGLPYLSTDAVLKAALPRLAGESTFYIPSPVHEAIISLLASLLIGGWLKEKYFSKVQRIFNANKSEAIASLLPQFGEKAVVRLVDSVIDGDRRKIVGCVRPLRASLILRNLLQKPLRSTFAILRHYVGEITFRFSPSTLETVCFWDPSSCGKSEIIQSVMPMVRTLAFSVEMRPIQIDSLERTEATTQRTRLVLWLAKEWLSRFTEKKHLTLCICTSRNYNLLLDSGSNLNKTTRWFTRFVQKLLPHYDLWILLDPAVEATNSASRQVAGTSEHLEAYCAFVRTRKSYVILDANKPEAVLAEDAYAAVVDALVRRTVKKLNESFQNCVFESN